MNQTKDEAVLNLCIRVFLAISTHEDLENSNNLDFLGGATEETINTFASGAITSLSFRVIPHLLALLEEWEGISDTTIIIKDSIDSFLNLENLNNAEATVDEIGELYFMLCEATQREKYYFQENLVFPGDLTKKLIQRVMLAVNKGEPLRMELIPSLLSIWTGERVPGDYNTIINRGNYKDFINYVSVISNIKWEKGKNTFMDIKYKNTTELKNIYRR